MKPTNIVMLVKDRVRLTVQALDSLYAHTALEEFTLTIVDDCSEQYARLAIMASALRYPNSTILRIERSRGITGQARNLGVYWSEKFFGRGDYLYLSDNDVYFTPGWLDKMIPLLQRPIALLGGSTHPYHGANSKIEFNECAVHTHDAVSGYSHLMRWGTWDDYGPHDAHAPGTSQSEDFKFCQDIIKGGGLVGSVWPEVVYCTGLTNTAGQPAVGADVMRRYAGVLQL